MAVGVDVDVGEGVGVGGARILRRYRGLGWRSAGGYSGGDHRGEMGDEGRLGRSR